MQYIKLLRLGEHIPLIGVILAASLYTRKTGIWIIWWSLGAICISIVVFMLNEIIDREDTDTYSWNPVHIEKNTRLNMKIVGVLFFLFTALGLLFSYLSEFFWWGIALWIIGVLYSLKPVRLKARFGLDILAQCTCAFIIPFLAPIWSYENIQSSLVFTAIFCCIFWAIVLPYQLADIHADMKAGLKNTHVVMGIKNSLFFGLFLALGGTILFISLGMLNAGVWLIIVLAMGIYAIFQYFIWLRMNSFNKQVLSMRKYVRIVKPLVQLSPLYFLAWMFITKLFSF